MITSTRVPAESTAYWRSLTRGDGGSTPVGIASSLGKPAQAGTIFVRDTVGGAEVRTVLDGPYVGPGTILDVTISVDDLVLHTMGGGAFEPDYPAAAFEVSRRSIHPHVPETYEPRLASIEFGTTSGLSSADVMPFFLISSPDEVDGLWFAVSWSGSWRVRLTKLRGGGHRLVVTALGADLDIPSGEAVELPEVVVGAYRGDGWAAVRHHLRAIRPRAHQGWAVYNSWFNEYADVSAAGMIETIGAASRLGLDAVVLDGGWYETDAGERGDFHTRGFGTWEPDINRFPMGVEPVARAAADAGLRLGLWCEFERAHPESAVALEHPDWLREAAQEKLRLLDLGKKAARDWVLEMLEERICSWSLRWLKLDMTTHRFDAYWIGDARGELAHLRGLYAILDELRGRHPDLVVEGCASGGGRIDREMIKRTDTYWLSDQTVCPELVRDTVANARRLLPAQYCYLSISPQLPEPPTRIPDEWIAGVMPGVFGVMDRIRTWPEALLDQVAAEVQLYHEIGPLLDGEPTRMIERDAPLLRRWFALEITGDSGSLLFAHRGGSLDSERTLQGSRKWKVSIAEPRGAVVGIDHSTAPSATVRLTGRVGDHRPRKESHRIGTQYTLSHVPSRSPRFGEPT